MLNDQVTGKQQGKELLIRRPRGKAVMSGPGARKGTKERSLWNREREQDLENIFREGIFSFFLLLVLRGCDRKGEFKMI